ncbi:hypothetical protein N7478_012355 [Penicillium angulare]|uniref:uncharacterized protein n=1 Tax=Penicillium angulare TaxID=116970 RepID=UPI00254204B0|nr:uncharacterized protein N7478_012355 [Penicillium angulare]KAJ5259374.1 hypothetical protein N7478_012355 [Penicillium angulare]
MEYSKLSFLPIPAAIRRQLPRLYSNRTGFDEDSSGIVYHGHGLNSFSDPQLSSPSFPEVTLAETRRPSTANASLDSFESRSAFNLLRNAGYEAQQPHADGRLARSLYVNALMYLLDALPADLTTEETTMLGNRLPHSVKSSLAISSSAQHVQVEGQKSTKAPSSPRSYLHRILASVIVYVFVLIRLFLPYIHAFLRWVYEYERSHRITQRIVATTLDAADELGKRSAGIGSTASKLNEGRLGTVIGNFASPSEEVAMPIRDKGKDKTDNPIDKPIDKQRVVVLNSPGISATSPKSSSLRRALPPGVYVSLAPADPTLWNGVIFVRHGPYASAILRFHIRFPDIYPDLPPLVTFTTDLFHPLIVPLTTYTFSTGSASDNPVSATDDERLPPGGFSLRHGFPHWFGRAKRSGLASGASSRNVSGGSAGTANTATKGIPESAGFITEETAPADASDDQVEDPENIDQSEEPPRVAQVPSINQFVETRKSVPVAELLDYIRSTFDDETVLDSLPVDVAGNPGAWHAWKAHRRGADSFGRSRRESPQARRPGDWHWDGIWARRVQDEIEASHSEPMLFGNAARGGGDETVSQITLLVEMATDRSQIRFSRLGDATLSSVKEKMESVVNVIKE